MPQCHVTTCWFAHHLLVGLGHASSGLAHRACAGRGESLATLTRGASINWPMMVHAHQRLSRFAQTWGLLVGPHLEPTAWTPEGQGSQHDGPSAHHPGRIPGLPSGPPPSPCPPARHGTMVVCTDRRPTRSIVSGHQAPPATAVASGAAPPMDTRPRPTSPCVCSVHLLAPHKHLP